MTLWIVESVAMRSGVEAFEDAVSSTGGECRWIDVQDETRGRYGLFPDGVTIVFRGSFEAAANFRERRPQAWPGVIGDEGRLRCSSYYPRLGSLLLNRDYRIVPLGQLGETWSELQRSFDSSSLFVRPDTGAKAFTGRVVEDLEEFWRRESIYLDLMSAEEPCIVARPQRIGAEYRMVVVGNRPVGGSRYKQDAQRDSSPKVPGAVWEFACQVAGLIEPPAEAYMLDVTTDEVGELKVIELNSFSCSALYDADPNPVVEAIDRHFSQDCASS